MTAMIWMDNLEVEVDFDYTAGFRGCRDRFGFQDEPDDVEDIVVKSVTLGEYDITELVFPRLSEIRERLLDDQEYWSGKD